MSTGSRFHEFKKMARSNYADSDHWKNKSGKLAHYKIPRYVHVVDEFPMTVTGKIRKIQMREEAAEIVSIRAMIGRKR